ncbi:MAG: asparagine synthase (glutamine-hydrolyzing), partial [Vicinamibacterales bacterium]
MCGIAGIVHTDTRPVDPAALQRMADAMVHRGPDGSGIWTADAVGLAHRRLAIIDLEGGRQPMRSTASGCVLSFNGEIYNYRDVRAHLRADGLPFAEHSDTEVVLRAFERWDESCVDRLQGMFAFAVWQPLRRRLFIARDRLGIKPLYYRWQSGTFTFASELKALLAALPDEPRRLDTRSFDAYLRLQYVPAPRTIVEGIRQLPPGHTLMLDVDAGQLVERRYWEARASRTGSVSVDDVQSQINRVVRSHMVADVPVGALLSGGVDSSLVVSHMAAAATAPVHTFSIGFDDPKLDESAEARAVAAHLGTTHHAHVVTDAEATDAFPHVIRAMDEPLADYAALPTWLIARFAAQHVKVVLTGEGADELFAGYRRYRRDLWLAPLARLRRPYQASHVFSTPDTARLLGRTPSPLPPAPIETAR